MSWEWEQAPNSTGDATEGISHTSNTDVQFPMKGVVQTTARDAVPARSNTNKQQQRKHNILSSVETTRWRPRAKKNGFRVWHGPTHTSIQHTHLQPDYCVLITRARNSTRRHLSDLVFTGDLYLSQETTVLLSWAHLLWRNMENRISVDSETMTSSWDLSNEQTHTHTLASLCRFTFPRYAGFTGIRVCKIFSHRTLFRNIVCHVQTVTLIRSFLITHTHKHVLGDLTGCSAGFLHICGIKCTGRDFNSNMPYRRWMRRCVLKPCLEALG